MKRFSDSLKGGCGGLLALWRRRWRRSSGSEEELVRCESASKVSLRKRVHDCDECSFCFNSLINVCESLCLNWSQVACAGVETWHRLTPSGSGSSRIWSKAKSHCVWHELTGKECAVSFAYCTPANVNAQWLATGATLEEINHLTLQLALHQASVCCWDLVIKSTLFKLKLKFARYWKIPQLV